MPVLHETIGKYLYILKVHIYIFQKQINESEDKSLVTAKIAVQTRVSTLHRISVFVQISVLFQKCTEKCTENLCISKQFYVPLLIKLFVIFIQLQHNHK